MNFDDSAWSSGQAPFYYNEALSGTLLGDMQNNYSCIFLRREFAITNVYEFGALTFAAQCDDGYVAWINGVEVARYNMPGGFVPFDGLAIFSVTEPVPYLATNILNPSSFLASGTNVLAVQVFNYLIGSGDLQFNASLAAFPDTNAPVIVALEPPGGSAVRKLSALQMAFSEKVANVNASDLMINGSPATNLVALDRRSSASTPQRTVMIPQTGSRAALRPGQRMHSINRPPSCWRRLRMARFSRRRPMSRSLHLRATWMVPFFAWSFSIAA